MFPFPGDQRVIRDSIREFYEDLVAAVEPGGHWLIIAAGISLTFVSELVFFRYGSANSTIRVLELALPMAVGVGLLWYGFQFRDHEFSSWQIAVLGIAVLVGMALFVVLAIYLGVLMSFEQQVPEKPIYVLLNAMAMGAVINFVYAYQYVKVKARAEDLENRVDRQSTILSRVSHDLRNPLTVAQGYADLVREERDDSARTRPLKAALNRIDSMIDELVVFAQSTDAEIHLTVVSLETTARDSWTMVETESGNLVVEDECEFYADPDRLQHLFENLFRNAVEHGSTSHRSQAHEDALEHGGEDVTVHVHELENGFAVEDDGPGIPEDARSEVFEAGYSTADGGTGLGLSIVKEVADAHGWHVDVTEGRMGGARFEITGVEFAGE